MQPAADCWTFLDEFVWLKRTWFVLSRQMGYPVATGAPRCNWGTPLQLELSGWSRGFGSNRKIKYCIPEVGIERAYRRYWDLQQASWAGKEKWCVNSKMIWSHEKLIFFASNHSHQLFSLMLWKDEFKMSFLWLYREINHKHSLLAKSSKRTHDINNAPNHGKS